MKSLRSKASRFFREGPSPDKKAAGHEDSAISFDAGIDIKKLNISRVFSHRDDKADKLSPSLPTRAPLSALFGPVIDRGTEHRLNDGFDCLPDYNDEDENDTEASQYRSPGSDPCHTNENVKGMSRIKKSCSNLAALKNKSSQFFKKTHEPSAPPPPLPPQISVEVPLDIHFPKPPPVPPALKFSTSPCPHRPIPTATLSVSRPQPLVAPDHHLHHYYYYHHHHPTILPKTHNQSVIPLEIHTTHAPPRPPRPALLDPDTLSFMRESATRMVLLRVQRRESSEGVSARSSTAVHTIEERLGLPSGYGTPAKEAGVLSCPLAVRGPLARPLSASMSSVLGSTSGEEGPRENKGGGGEEGEDKAPVELYRASKEGDWVLEKKVSRGENGGGMVFRDRWGAFHFVKNV